MALQNNFSKYGALKISTCFSFNMALPNNFSQYGALKISTCFSFYLFFFNIRTHICTLHVITCTVTFPWYIRLFHRFLFHFEQAAILTIGFILACRGKFCEYFRIIQQINYIDSIFYA